MSTACRKAQRVLPISEWPPADGVAWGRALEPGDVLEPGGPAAGWSMRTVGKHQKGYGRWLAFLASHDQLDAATSPIDRAIPDSVASYARELSTMNSPRTVIGRLEELRDVLRVMAPRRDWSWIGRIAARCGRREADILRKRARLRSSPELYQLGVDLMKRAGDIEFGTPLKRAVAFRDGLMIAILAARPLRRGSLAALQLTDISGRGDTMWMTVPEEATKTGSPIELPLPATLSEAITAYLNEHRPVLLRGITCDAFWVSQARRAMGAMAIYLRIVKLTREAFGVPINPHLFRDAAATTIAIEDPVHVRVAATVLGHKSLRVTEKHYDQSQMIHACRCYQKFLSGRRHRRRSRSDLRSQ